MTKSLVFGVINLLSFILFSPIVIYSQLSFEELLADVSQLGNDIEHREFLEKLNIRDQKYRGSNASITNDYQNILLASIYINNYGYPNLFIDPSAKILPYIWVHCWFKDIEKISFPIVYQGYIKGYITSDTFENYFLRGLYKSFNNNIDNDFNNLDVSDILSILKPNLVNEIDINRIIEIYSEYLDLLENLSPSLGIWCYTPQSKEYIMPNGSIFYDKPENIYIEIRKLDDRFYLKKYGENWLETTFVKCYSDSNYPNRFRLNQSDLYYYEYVKGKDLEYKDNDGNVVVKFQP